MKCFPNVARYYYINKLDRLFFFCRRLNHFQSFYICINTMTQGSNVTTTFTSLKMASGVNVRILL